MLPRIRRRSWTLLIVIGLLAAATLLWYGGGTLGPAPGPASSLPGAAGPPTEPAAATATIAANDLRRQNVSTMLAGRVSYRDGAAAGSVSLHVEGEGVASFEARADANGRFAISMPRELRLLRITVSGPGTVPEEHAVDLTRLPRDGGGRRTVALLVRRRVRIPVSVEVDPRLARWLHPRDQVRLLVTIPSLAGLAGFDRERELGPGSKKTLLLAQARQPAVLVADESREHDHASWAVECHYEAMWFMRWGQQPVRLDRDRDDSLAVPIRFHLSAAETVRGILQSKAGHAIQRCRITLTQPGAAPALFYTRADGRFMLHTAAKQPAKLTFVFPGHRMVLEHVQPGQDLGVVRMDVSRAIRVRLLDAGGEPILRYHVGVSNLHERPSAPARWIDTHPGGITILRATRLHRGARLFFEGKFGQMIYELPAALQGSTEIVDVHAKAAPTGDLTMRLRAPVELTPRHFVLRLAEVREAARGSENVMYSTFAMPVGGAWHLESLMTGDYEYELKQGGTVLAKGYVSVHEGTNVHDISPLNATGRR